VDATLDLLIDGEAGIWHLASAGAVSWADFARMAADRCGLDAARVEAVPAARLGWAARRPVYSVLGSERGSIMPALDDALGRYVAACSPVPSQIGPAEGLAEYFRTHHAR